MVVAVLVDERWEVGVVEHALPRGAPAAGESGEHAILRILREHHEVDAEVVAPLGPDAFVCRARGPGRDLAWWPASRAMRELSDAGERRLVRKAMGPC